MTTTYRSAVNERLQFGPETTPGAGGTANKKPTTLMIDMGFAGNANKKYIPGGAKYVGAVVPADQWGEGPISGVADFNELPYLAACNVGYTAPITTAGATTWRHTPNVNGAATLKTLVAQLGQAGAVETYRNIFVPDFGIKMSRDEVTVNGKAVGKRQVYGTALDVSTKIPRGTTSGLKASILTASTFAGLASGATKVDPYGFDLDWHHNGFLAPFFPMDDAIVPGSFGGVTEGDPDAACTFTIAYDVNSGDLAGPVNLATMDNGSIFYIRGQVLGAQIAAGPPAVNNAIILDMCLQVQGPPKKSKVGNLRVIQYTCICVIDDTAGVPYDLTFINTLSGL